METNPYKSPSSVNITPPGQSRSVAMRDLVSAGIAHVLGVAAAAPVVIWLGVDRAELALVVGAILGTQAAAWSYCKRAPGLAPPATKAAVGAVLAVLCVLTSTLLQLVWGWMRYPVIEIPIAAVGSFGFPFVLFGTAQDALLMQRMKKRR